MDAVRNPLLMFLCRILAFFTMSAIGTFVLLTDPSESTAIVPPNAKPAELLAPRALNELELVAGRETGEADSSNGGYRNRESSPGEDLESATKHNHAVDPVVVGILDSLRQSTTPAVFGLCASVFIGTL